MNEKKENGVIESMEDIIKDITITSIRPSADSLTEEEAIRRDQENAVKAGVKSTLDMHIEHTMNEIKKNRRVREY